MKKSTLPKVLRARVSEKTYQAIQSLLAQSTEGTGESDIVRQAIIEYIERKNPKLAAAAKIKAASDDEF